MPKSHVTFVKEFASCPSMKNLLFSRSTVSNASSGEADHSGIFLPQYMRMWLCMYPVSRISASAIPSSKSVSYISE
ncbi:hypothetical protein SQ03_15720 [Methylobacterium platani JCM 14648]|uniref:Uncharacterized protein n=2 Tax=Methylobacterium platani TaxID=427683 RepID=A0A179SB43_9HYPH|nr:hypothetical protein SQ03_15720 [Methylobacterium platani JCM 14648]OAS24848.1 hypothetical protein A5481_12190 [Methylobacterium platani]